MGDAGNSLQIFPKDYQYGDYLWNGQTDVWMWKGQTRTFPWGNIYCCLPDNQKIDKNRVDDPEQILAVYIESADAAIQVDRYKENIDLHISMAVPSYGNVGYCGDMDGTCDDEQPTWSSPSFSGDSDVELADNYCRECPKCNTWEIKAVESNGHFEYAEWFPLNYTFLNESNTSPGSEDHDVGRHVHATLAPDVEVEIDE